MKKFILAVFFFTISIFSFSVINDNLNLLKEEEKTLIDEKIAELKEEEHIDIFVNTLLVDEGFTVKDPEKTLIFNIKKSENNENYEIETSWSKDINIDEQMEAIDTALEGAKDFLEKEEYANYILSVLDGFQEILKDIDIETQADMRDVVQEKSPTAYRKYFLLVGIVIFVLAKVYSIKDKKRKKTKSSKEKGEE